VPSSVLALQAALGRAVVCWAAAFCTTISTPASNSVCRCGVASLAPWRLRYAGCVAAFAGRLLPAAGRWRRQELGTAAGLRARRWDMSTAAAPNLGIPSQSGAVRWAVTILSCGRALRHLCCLCRIRGYSAPSSWKAATARLGDVSYTWAGRRENSWALGMPFLLLLLLFGRATIRRNGYLATAFDAGRAALVRWAWWRLTRRLRLAPPLFLPIKRMAGMGVGYAVTGW